MVVVAAAAAAGVDDLRKQSRMMVQYSKPPNYRSLVDHQRELNRSKGTRHLCQKEAVRTETGPDRFLVATMRSMENEEKGEY